jgi:cyclohexa-1,5-dienecarbonyl-CoA hydratase
MIETVIERGGAWVRVVLAEPPGNLLSRALVGALRERIAAVRERSGLKWLTLESALRDFSFGASIPEHLPEEMPDVLPQAHALLKDLLACPCPTAALVCGRCLGGGFELALACDDIIATHDANLGLPEVQLAAFPPAAAALLPVRVGASRAARAMLTGEAHPAGYWEHAGLLTMISPQASLLTVAGEWFDRYFAPRSAVALAHVAEASRLAWRKQAEATLDAAEAQYLDRLLKTADAREGIEAWIEKRTPNWKNA